MERTSEQQAQIAAILHELKPMRDAIQSAYSGMAYKTKLANDRARAAANSSGRISEHHTREMDRLFDAIDGHDYYTALHQYHIEVNKRMAAAGLPPHILVSQGEKMPGYDVELAKSVAAAAAGSVRSAAKTAANRENAKRPRPNAQGKKKPRKPKTE